MGWVSPGEYASIPVRSHTRILDHVAGGRPLYREAFAGRVPAAPVPRLPIPGMRRCWYPGQERRPDPSAAREEGSRDNGGSSYRSAFFLQLNGIHNEIPDDEE